MPKIRSRHHSSQQERGPGGRRFGRSCGCQFHHDADNDCELISIHKGRKLQKKVLDSLLEQAHIKKWTKYICKACVAKATKSELPKAAELPEGQLSSEDTTGQSDNSEDSDNTLLFECKNIGTEVGKIVKEDINELYHLRKPSLVDLQKYDPLTWLEERPPELVNLLKHICNIDKLDDKRAYLLAKTIEQIYYVRNTKLILPLCMRENLLLYSFTTSKLGSSLLGSVGPAGSYRTLHRCLDSEAETPISFPDGTVRCAFDNNQIIGKTYTIKGDNKIPTSVLCSSAYIELNQGDIQQNEKYEPASWMWEKLNEKKGQLLVLSDEYDNFFRDSRDTLLQEFIREVAKEHAGSEAPSDHIDEFVKKQQEAETEKVCTECGGENDVTYRFCRNCGGQLIKAQPPNIELLNPQKVCSPYIAFADVTTKVSHAKVLTGEPDFINPNSYDTIVKVLQNIGIRAGIKRYGGEKRSWLFVECDGLPYKIMRDLMDNLWLCEKCQKSFYGLDNFEAHMCFVLHKNNGIRELSWIVPVVGLLHLEMNVARSFLKLNWKVFVSRLAYVLGFKSEKAQRYCLKGSDHHKTWRLLEILYIALTKELLTPYVKECLENREEPSVVRYWDWSQKVQDANYALIQQMTLTYLHALMLFRVGIRRNNLEAICAAKTRFIPLFYAQHHPRYQEILFRDMHDQVLMPQEMKATLHASYTTNRTGHKGHYQGGDACLEEINKDAKSWLKHTGVPNNNRWQRVFRNLDKLKEIRETGMKHTKVSDSCKVNMEKELNGKEISTREVDLVRSTVRRLGYLAAPKEEKCLTDIEGKIQLNPELVNFTISAKEKTNEYIEAVIQGQVPKIKKIHVTAQELAESSKVESMTIPEIRDKIHRELETLSPHDAAQFQETYQKTVKCGVKQKYIDLYYEILEAIVNMDEDTGCDDETVPSDSDSETES